MLSYGWQSDGELWKLISGDVLLGKSWRYVGFTELDAVAVPIGEAGVYMICASPVKHRFSLRSHSDNVFANLLTPIYIGKTTNLRDRFLNHCRNPSTRVRDAGVCYGESLVFWFHALPLERISQEEAVLIQCFGPPANGREEVIDASMGEPIPIGMSSD
ncbi:MAG: GIY-YIG nuclease family protein [Gammaproteobacteria bacterium]|nr:GIY-YIG nuclease family protein [Gammaproteobacteria bacterium]